MSQHSPSLRRGWTTGTCATAAAKAAWAALQGRGFPDPVQITLPGGQTPSFVLAAHGMTADGAWVEIVKDAGDDPDVTHGATIRATLHCLPEGSGTVFYAGEGVGHVTRPGLPIPPGEPAINPVPRQMIRTALADITPGGADVAVTLSIPGGEILAQRTLNARLGIVGGLSILGTTGIVVPFSCSAWIDSIQRGIDVARAMGLTHLVAATGDTSERAAQALLGVPDAALIEMGDFAGGVLKYLRDHPVNRLTVAGGLAKIAKLAQGRMDLHSRRGMADMSHLAAMAVDAGLVQLADAIAAAPTVAEAFLLAGPYARMLGDHVAHVAQDVALGVVGTSGVAVDVIIFDRAGLLVGQSAGSSHQDRNRLR